MKKLVGNKKFYMMVLAVAVPIMIQNGITNFVNLLDNIMVGQIGTEQMTGVAIVNQLILVFNVCIFGVISGAGIFGTQFYGSGNYEGLRNTFRFKLIFCILFTILAISIFIFGGSFLIQAYLHEGSAQGDLAQSLLYGRKYLGVILMAMLPYAISQVYASTLRETGETLLPMKSSIAAVLLNLLLNYVLIFGKLGAPVMGVEGAAIATVISRLVEAVIIIVWTHIHKGNNEFICGVYRTLKVPSVIVRNIIIRGTPLMINEALWAGGMAVLAQCYSVRGLSVVAGYNISSTILNVFNIVFIALGGAVSIIVGQLLGAQKMEEAKDVAHKLIFFSTASCVVVGIVMSLFAQVFPQLYNTTQEVKGLAEKFILISALCMPLQAFTHAAYFTLRSGGKTVITFIFDSGFVWMANIPLAFCLTRFTELPIVWVFLFCQMVEIIKCVIGFWLVKKEVWVQNIVVEE